MESLIALVTDEDSLHRDCDMAPIVGACQSLGLAVEVCSWENEGVDWGRFDIVIPRSPWAYVHNLSRFLAWCRNPIMATRMLNPPPVAEWSLDKRYMTDLARYGVPVIPSVYIGPGVSAEALLGKFVDAHCDDVNFVAKPTVGAGSKGVRRFSINQLSAAIEHVERLNAQGSEVILQPYLDTVDRCGETDLVYFNGIYSHAIKKRALLMPDGIVHKPTLEFRQAGQADNDERQVAEAALEAASKHWSTGGSLLYGRVDLVRGYDGKPMVLELELCEPNLSITLSEGGAMRFARALACRVS